MTPSEEQQLSDVHRDVEEITAAAVKEFYSDETLTVDNLMSKWLVEAYKRGFDRARNIALTEKKC